MVTSLSVGSNLIPQRWLGKMLRRSNLSAKDMTFYTDINQRKGKTQPKKTKWPKKVNMEVK